MNKDEQKKEETKKDSSTNKINEGNQPQTMRKIVIEFNSNSINITKANVASNFELQAVLENVLKKIAVQ